MSYATKEQCEEFLKHIPLQSCFQCRFFEPFDLCEINIMGFAELPGECHRRSPVIKESEQDGCNGFWPEVHYKSWCGDYQPRVYPRDAGDICAADQQSVDTVAGE